MLQQRSTANLFGKKACGLVARGFLNAFGKVDRRRQRLPLRLKLTVALLSQPAHLAHAEGARTLTEAEANVARARYVRSMMGGEAGSAG